MQMMTYFIEQPIAGAGSLRKSVYRSFPVVVITGLQHSVAGATLTRVCKLAR